MPIYDINFILELSKSIQTSKLNPDVENYLNDILLDIKKPLYNIVPNFNSNFYNKNYKSKNKNNNINNKNMKKTYQKDNLDLNCNNLSVNKIEDLNSYKINRLKEINNKSEYEMIISNIRKILNKITQSNYDKLKNEFLCYYNSIYDNKINLEKININKINIFILDSLVYNNIIFNNIYCDLLNNLININSEFSNLLNNYLDIFTNIYKYIKLSNSSTNFDEITLINRHNDKYKCFCRFYIFCYKIKLISIESIINTIKNLQEELLNNIKLENKKEYNEIITEFLFLITSNLIITNKELIINLKYISNLKNNSYPSISNKIIFKHKDIVDKFLN